MLNTFQNSASVLSIGFFFTVITLGPGRRPPHALFGGLTAQGVPAPAAQSISHLSPIGSLFAAFLGINPIHQLLGAHLLAHPGVHAGYLTGRSFFPNLIAGPFGKGLRLAFSWPPCCASSAPSSRGCGARASPRCMHSFARGRRGGPGRGRRRGHVRGRRLAALPVHPAGPEPFGGRLFRPGTSDGADYGTTEDHPPASPAPTADGRPHRGSERSSARARRSATSVDAAMASVAITCRSVAVHSCGLASMRQNVPRTTPSPSSRGYPAQDTAENALIAVSPVVQGRSWRRPR